MNRSPRKLLALTGIIALGAGVATALFRRLGGRNGDERSGGAGVAVRRGEGPVRSAGPEGMRSKTDRPWTAADEASDESFPASDPPGSGVRE
jgi:hypothetical protein